MILLPWIVVAVTFAIGVALLFSTFKNPKAERLGQGGNDALTVANTDDSAGHLHAAPPSTQQRPALTPRRRHGNASVTLRDRMVHAGFYEEGLEEGLRVLRFALLGLAVLVVYVVSALGLMSWKQGLLLGLMVGISAAIAPGLLLGHLKRKRQAAMRLALPDALDVIVICLEAGLSLSASFARVARELAEVHPTLSLELKIVEREVQMGRSLGDAVRNFAARFDLEELRSLSVAVGQADRFGASVTRGFRVFADGMRLKRQQRAEEMAHKASVKLIFPTAFFIFPAMFVVTLGPALLKAMDTLLPIFLEAEYPKF